MIGWLALASILIAVPHALSLSQQEVLVLLTINVLLVASYRLLTLTGEWSLGHVVIMGVGAYSSALYTKELGVYVPVSMILGACTAALQAGITIPPKGLCEKGDYSLCYCEKGYANRANPLP